MRFTRSHIVIEDWKRFTQFRAGVGLIILMLAFIFCVSLTRGNEAQPTDVKSVTADEQRVAPTPSVSPSPSSDESESVTNEIATSTSDTVETTEESVQPLHSQTLSQSIPHGILTPSGYKNIADIKVGDQVIGYNLETNSQVTNTVTQIEFKKPEHYDTWELNEDGVPTTKIERSFVYYTINQQYELFQDQSIFANGRVVHASELKIGDKVVLENGQEIIINDIFSDEAHADWLRFSVSGDHSYIQDGLVVHNASRYWVGGGSSVNWNATANTNWSATSGGSNNASVPGASDDVIFDGVGTGASNSTISTTITINSLDMTGYANTLTHTGSITVTIAGNLFKLSSGMTYSLGNSGSTFLFSSASGTSGSPTSITTAGKGVGGITITGAGYFVAQDNISMSGSFSLSNGTFVAPTTMGSVNTFTISSGTFVAPSGTLTVNGTFTISGGTFTHNSGTLTFGGTSTATLSCNNVTFNTVRFTHTSSVKTVSSNCTFPVGNNPSLGGNSAATITVIGTLTGSGTLTTSGTLTASSTNPISGFDAASLNSFSLTAGTFVAPIDMTVNGTFTISGGTFDANNGTLTFGQSGSGNVLSCNNATFNLVRFTHTTSTKTVGSNCIMPLGNNPYTGSAGITLNGTFTGTGTLTTGGTFTINSTNPLSGFTALSSSALVLTSGTFTAPASTTISSTFTISGGTFDANNGIISFSGGTATLSCNNVTFNLVVFTNTGTKTIQNNCTLPLGNNPTVSNSITLLGTLTGSGTLTTGNTFTSSSTNPISGFNALDAVNFVLTAGSFTAPTNMYVATTFTISGGTFNHNNGTLYFDGNVTGNATISCNNATFNLVVFAHNTNIRTVSSNCTLPLGNNPTMTSTGDITLNGTLTGTGILNLSDVNTTLVLATTGVLQGFTGLEIGNSLSLGGTLDASNYTTFDIHENFAVTSTGIFTAPSSVMLISENFSLSAGSTFNANGGIVEFYDSAGDTTGTLSCNNATFNLVRFVHTINTTRTISTDCTIPVGNNPTVGAGGNIVLNGTLTGTGLLTTTGTFYASSTNPFSGFTGLDSATLRVDSGTLDLSSYTPVTITNDFSVSNGATFTAPVLMSVADDWDVRTGATFNHNNGTVVLNGTNLSQAIYGSTTFYNLTKTTTHASELIFKDSNTQTIAHNLILQGEPGNLLTLKSSAPGTQFLIDAQGTSNLSYLNVQDSNAATPLSTLGVDSGNNTNWTITPIPVIVESSGGSTSSGGSGYIPGYGPTGLLAQNSSSSGVCTNGALFNTQTGERCATIAPVAQPVNVVKFTRNLKLGDTDSEVKALQQYLNAQGFTISTTGAGSRWNETTFFGKLTQTALAKFQKSKAIAPAFGYFGIITRTYISTH